jgi:hypothetical protein
MALTFTLIDLWADDKRLHVTGTGDACAAMRFGS